MACMHKLEPPRNHSTSNLARNALSKPPGIELLLQLMELTAELSEKTAALESYEHRLETLQV
eukprot:6183780-Pleurochrysis_carterae.AAC.1